MARSTLSMVVSAVALSLVGVGTSTAAPPPKVDICHFQEEEGTWTKISVGGDAPGAHLANHDDALVGDVTTKTGTPLDADCQPVAGGSSCGDCLATGHGPGCTNLACEEAVCLTDPACCSDSWDGACASEALSTCLEGNVCSGEPACGNCVTAHEGTGCQFSDCQAAVCASDSFCCNARWDEICAEEAFDVCAIVDASLCTATP